MTIQKTKPSYKKCTGCENYMFRVICYVKTNNGFKQYVAVGRACPKCHKVKLDSDWSLEI